MNPGYDEIARPAVLPVDRGGARRRSTSRSWASRTRGIEQAMRATRLPRARGRSSTFSSLYEAETGRSPDAPPLTERLAAIARRARHGDVRRQRHGVPAPRAGSCARRGSRPTTPAARARSRSSRTRGRRSRRSRSTTAGSGSTCSCRAARSSVSTMADYVDYALGREDRRACSRCCSRPCAIPAGFASRARARRRARRPRGRAEDRPHRRARPRWSTAHSGRARGRARRVRGAVRRVRRARVPHARPRWPTRSSCSRRRAGRRSGAASRRVHDSGGERAMFVDLAHDLGVPFARAVRRHRSRAIDDALDPGLEAANPLDAWGTGIDADRDLPRGVRRDGTPTPTSPRSRSSST